MTPTVVNQWTATRSMTSTYVIPWPVNLGTIASVASTTGNWLIAVVGWQQAPGYKVAMTIGDDVHNHWIPVAVSSSAGATRTAVWVAPNARAAHRVHAAPSGFARAVVLNVVEVAGMPTWAAVDQVATGYANAAQTLAVTMPVPSQQVLAVAACTSDNLSYTTTLNAGGGWSALNTVTVTNGVDHTDDADLVPAWQATSGSVTAGWAASGALDMSGVVVGIQLTPTAPTQSNPNWPLMRLELGFGAGLGTPWDEITWTDVTDRFLTMDSQRGVQYELGSVEAGTVTFTLRNDDGALSPGNPASPYYPNVRIYTPIRVLATWQGRVYPVFRGYVERWPQTWNDPHFGVVDMVAVDAYATLTTTLPTMVRGEKLLDQPYAYWPLDDAQGATAGSNISKTGAGQIQQVLSKNGADSATAGFGNNSSGAIWGEPNSTTWQQTGLTAYNQGYCLVYQDSNLPPISGGVTIEFWAQVSNSQPSGYELVLAIVKNGAGAVIQVYLDPTTGYPSVAWWDAVTRVRTNAGSISAWGDRRNNNWTHYVLAFDQTSFALHVNADSLGAPLTGSCNLAPDWQILSICGQSDQYWVGQMLNGSFAHVAVYPRKLEQARIVTHYVIDGLLLSDYTDWRLHRLLSYAGWGQARAIDSVDTMLGGHPDTDGRTVADCLNDPATTDNGWLYVDRCGYLHYLAKRWGFNLPRQYVLGDRPDLGEVPYTGDITIDYDPTQVYNDVTVTQDPGSRNVAGVVVNSSDLQSQVEYGDLTLQRTVYFAHEYTSNVTDLANWLRYRYAQPRLRIQQVTLNPAAYPVAFEAALTLDVADVVTVNRRPVGGPVISGDYQIQQVQHSVDFSQGTWTTTFSLVPADPPALTCDDPTYGQLNGTNVISY